MTPHIREYATPNLKMKSPNGKKIMVEAKGPVLPYKALKEGNILVGCKQPVLPRWVQS